MPCRCWCVVVTAAVLVVLMLFAVGVGSVSVPLADTWRIVVSHLTGGGPAGDLVFDQVVLDFRVPRVLLAALCGAGLSVAGVVLQALVANPLAEPYVLGLTPGASLGAVLVITAGGGIVGGLSVSLAAFVGAMIAAVLVFALGQQHGRLAPTRLVLSGIAVGYVFIALTSYVQLKATPSELRRVMFWLLGSVAGAEWDQLGWVTGVVLTSTHLDIRARFELLDLIRATGITTLAVLHDLDLAARCCDHLVVLHDGRITATGPVLYVLTPTILREVFGVVATAERHPDGIIRVAYGAEPLA